MQRELLPAAPGYAGVYYPNSGGFTLYWYVIFIIIVFLGKETTFIMCHDTSVVQDHLRYNGLQHNRVRITDLSQTHVRS